MKVAIVCTSAGGGAGIAALRLHQGLIRGGVESTVFAFRGQSDRQQGIVRVQRTISGSLSRLSQSVFNFPGGSLDKSTLATPVESCELFSDCRSVNGRALPRLLQGFDIVNLHWVARFVDLPRFFSQFAGRVPIVWTLHDMQAFTGGCHYSVGCEKYRTECHHCHQLKHSGPNDASHQIFQARIRGMECLADSDLHVVAPSRWLVKESASSAALGRFSVSHIPYGLDISVLAPGDRVAARSRLQLPIDRPVLLFVADSTGNPRKGIDLLYEAIGILADRFPDLHLAVVGQSHSAEALGPFPERVTMLGSVSDVGKLAEIYGAADLFVVPSREDNLPNTVIESIACGTPVVGFRCGGIPDMVREGITGWLASSIDSSSLSDTIARALLELRDPAVERGFRRRCREVACSEYRLEIQASRYQELFSRLKQ